MTNLIASRKDPVKFPFFYGWLMIIISGLGIFFSGPGQTYSVSVFIDSYIKEFGWSRSFVSSLYSAGTLVAGLLLPLIGREIDTRGHRQMMPLISLVFAVACLWMSIVFHPIMLFVGFILIRLFGQGAMSLVSSTLAPQWFEKKRGRALSLMTLGGVAGSALLPPLNTWIIETFHWRVGWQFWAFLLITVMAPLSYWLVRNKPEDIGLLPDNERVQAREEKVTSNESPWTLRQAKRTRSFWLIIFCMFVPSMVNTGITFHMVSIVAEKGLPPSVAALVLSTIALVALPFTFLAGFVLDRAKPHKILILSFVGQVALMVYLDFISSTQTAIFFGVMRGVITGFEAMIFNVIWPNYFGRTHLGSIRGYGMIFMVIGSAFGPLPFGLAYDLFGGYTEILVVMTIFPVLAAAASFLALPPEGKER